MVAFMTSNYYFSDLISDVLCLAQAFEWSIMINMIIYQNGKVIPEIMALLSEKSSRD
jgi:hypothetical protein